MFKSCLKHAKLYLFKKRKEAANYKCCTKNTQLNVESQFPIHSTLLKLCVSLQVVLKTYLQTTSAFDGIHKKIYIKITTR